MTPEQMRDASMLELFQVEAQQQGQVLNQGLITLERDPKQSEALENCMRAAHSLKGAARIVGLEAGVRIAHVMEDLLVATIDRQLTLTSAHIDALLAGTDLLLNLATLDQELALQKVEVLSERLLGLLRDKAVLIEALPAPVSNVTAESAPSVDVRDKVLRVTAERLDHLLDVAGKALVQFQTIKPLDQSLQRLRKLHTHLGRSLDGLRESLLEVALDSRSQGLLDETRQALQASQALLSQHLAEFDDFTWQGSQRAQQVYDAALASRMRPFADVLTGQTRMVRDLGRALGKQVCIEVEGETLQVDRDVLEGLEAPLTHLLRNALDHGIELPQMRLAKGKAAQGTIKLVARHHAGLLLLTVSDDGQGVDLEKVRRKVLERGLANAQTAEQLSESELLSFLFLPGFSLSTSVTEISGRGVGLDAVQHMLRRLRGGVRMEQCTGYGTTFHLEVPLTLSVVRSLVVKIAGEAYAWPLAALEHMLKIEQKMLVMLEGRQHFWHQDSPVGLISAAQLLGQVESEQGSGELNVVVLKSADRNYGVTVEQFIGERTLVVMPLDARLGKVKDIAAGALLDDGTPVLILDAEDLVHSIEKILGSGRWQRVDRQSLAGDAKRGKKVLVVDDSLTVRELERKLLVNAGYHVTVAIDGMDGWNALRADNFDLLITDIDMPRMDGIELVTLVRRDKRLQSLPVMVVSYKDREEDRLRGLDAGADYYLAKASFHDQALLEAVEVLIGEGTA